MISFYYYRIIPSFGSWLKDLGAMKTHGQREYRNESPELRNRITIEGGVLRDKALAVIRIRTRTTAASHGAANADWL